ncbi:MAG: hypothetical protein A2Y56_10515 [Candidatus Aminicenantes bacterium RBG_13_63_10]|nr:MAG: hypothetical protein A2Y56_10515 [Candidatus Aminicenantes bacterium RBG_13_63_10]
MTEYARYTKALTLFHLRVGARVALRALAPVVGLFIFVYYVLKPEFSAFLTRVLLFENGLLVSGLSLALVALAASRATASRVLVGAAGWIRHLPLSSSGHRRLAVFSAAVAGLPVFFIMAFLTVLAGQSAGRSVAWYLAGFFPMGLASSLFWTPLKNARLSRPPAFLSCALLGAGHPLFFAAGLAMLVLADLVAGPMKRKGRTRLFVPFGRKPGLEHLISLRAVGWTFVPLYLLSYAVLILTQLFILNNRLAGSMASAAARFGGTASIVLFMAFLAARLAARRPPWPWLRSQAISARGRVTGDAAFLAVPCLPLVAVTTALNVWAGLPVLILLPLLAVRAAAHIRGGPDSRTGPGLALVVEGGLAALAAALLPWLSLVSLAGTPWALSAAARRDRRLKVSRWTELHHLAAGDSQSWSAT